MKGYDYIFLRKHLNCPKVVLFDVYDTLVMSTIGDLEEQRQTKTGPQSFIETARRFEFDDELGIRWHHLFFEYIDKEHKRCRDISIMRAEVFVDLIWEEILEQTIPRKKRFDRDAQKMGLYREMKANPLAPFRGITELWSFLFNNGISIGLVTNAQYYTLPIISWILNTNLDTYLMTDIVVCSYRLGFAKPDPYFFRYVETQILRLGWTPEEVWIVGNDPVNDITSSKPYGFGTVLFAGRNPHLHEYADATVGSFNSLQRIITKAIK